MSIFLNVYDTVNSVSSEAISDRGSRHISIRTSCMATSQCRSANRRRDVQRCGVVGDDQVEPAQRRREHRRRHSNVAADAWSRDESVCDAVDCGAALRCAAIGNDYG